MDRLVTSGDPPRVGWRGLISGLGAGLSLVVAGVVALTLITTLLAFDGLPILSASRDIAEIRLPDAPPPARAADARRVRSSAPRAVRLPSRETADGTPPPGAAPPPVPPGERAAPDAGGEVPRPAPAPPPPAEPVTPPAPAPVITPGPIEDVTRQVQEVLDPVVQAAEDVTSALPLAAP